MSSLLQEAHASLKNAFTQKYKTVMDKVTDSLNSSSIELRESMGQQFISLKKAIKDELDVDVENGLILEDVVQQAKKFVTSEGVRHAVETGVAYVAKETMELEGPIGMLLSEAVTIIGGEILVALTGKSSLEEGQWVFIDIGAKARLINQKPKVVQFSGSFDPFANESFVTIPDELDYLPEAKHTLGFYVSSTEWKNYNIFSMEDGAIHEYGPEKIRPAPKEFADRLDSNQHFARLRASFFMKREDPSLKTFLPTSPGEKVIYNKAECVIVECFGEEYIIQEPNGNNVEVHASQLLPAPGSGTVSYDNRKIGLGSFDSLGLARFFTGEWVWIPSGDVFEGMRKSRRLQEVDSVKQMHSDWVLGMVDSVEGNTLHMVRAYDGKAVDVQRNEACIASDGVQRNLNQDSVFSKWKSNILTTNVDPRQSPPGTIKPLVTLGFGSEADSLKTSELLKEIETTVQSETKVTKGASDEVLAREIVRLNDNEEIRRIQADDIQRYEAVYRQQPKTGEDTNGSFQVIMVAMAAGLLYVYLSK